MYLPLILLVKLLALIKYGQRKSMYICAQSYGDTNDCAHMGTGISKLVAIICTY